MAMHIDGESWSRSVRQPRGRSRGGRSREEERFRLGSMGDYPCGASA